MLPLQSIHIVILLDANLRYFLRQTTVDALCSMRKHQSKDKELKSHSALQAADTLCVYSLLHQHVPQR